MNSKESAKSRSIIGRSFKTSGMEAFTKSLLNTFSVKGCYKLKPGEYKLVPFSFANFYNLVIHCKEKISLKRLDMTERDSITEFIWLFLIEKYSKINGNPFSNYCKKIESKSGDAHILCSEPLKRNSVILYKVVNASKEFLHVRFDYVPKKHVCKAKLGSKKLIIEFEATEIIQFIEIKNVKTRDCVEEKGIIYYNCENQIRYSEGAKQVIVKPKRDKNVGFIHRWVDLPNAFRDHCRLYRRDIYDNDGLKDFHLEEIVLKDIEVKISAEFKTD